MLPKKNRLTKKIFQNILKDGRVVSTGLLRFHFIKSDDNQFAFVAPKNIFKNAIKRNKVRRMGYNVLRFIKKENISGIFFYKKQDKNITTKEVKDEVISIFKKIKTTKEY